MYVLIKKVITAYEAMITPEKDLTCGKSLHLQNHARGIALTVLEIACSVERIEYVGKNLACKIQTNQEVFFKAILTNVCDA